MKVIIVNMGVGEDVSKKNPMRIFENKDDAITWVKECFLEQIKELEYWKNLSETSHYGLSIGNSFHLQEWNVETHKKT